MPGKGPRQERDPTTEAVPSAGAEARAGFREHEGMPSGLLQRPAERVHEVLDGPTLIHLPGRMDPPVFVSVLLHGNETTGWEAVRRVLTELGDGPLPRSLSLFVGNVAAAREGLRLLAGQPDYNRIWRGGNSPEHAMAARILARMAERGVFASLDIHNNTGRNPHYACVNRLEHRFLQLATLFGRTVVYFIRPETVQSLAFAELAPAVTVECGRPGEPAGVDHAARFLKAVLHIAELPDDPVPQGDYDLYHTVARVRVREDLRFGFEEGDLVLREDLDRLNFAEVPPGTGLGEVRFPARGVEEVLDARDERDERVTGRYFTLEEGRLSTRLPVMPSMLTRDPAIIRQDCLCYLMERLPPLG